MFCSEVLSGWPLRWIGLVLPDGLGMLVALGDDAAYGRTVDRMPDSGENRSVALGVEAWAVCNWSYLSLLVERVVFSHTRGVQQVAGGHRWLSDIRRLVALLADSFWPAGGAVHLFNNAEEAGDAKGRP